MKDKHRFEVISEIEIVATMRVPIKARMTILDAAGEAAFVYKSMATPGNCDNDLSDSENREWFAALWREQVRFQQLLLADPEHLSKYLAVVAAQEIEHNNLLVPANPAFFIVRRFYARPALRAVAFAPGAALPASALVSAPAGAVAPWP